MYNVSRLGIKIKLAQLENTSIANYCGINISVDWDIAVKILRRNYCTQANVCGEDRIAKQQFKTLYIA